MRRVFVVLFALLAGCSGGGGDQAATTTTSSPAESTTTTTAAPTTTTTTAPPGPPVAASDVPGLAAQAASAERDVRDPAVTGPALLRAGWTQQVVSRALAVSPELSAKVLAAVPAEYRASVDANVTAAAELRALTKPRDALPPWRIVAPAPADELLGYYRAAEAEVGVPWTILASIHFVETKLGRIRGTSTAGAQGPMQFLPSTWEQYGGGGDINSNRDAILAAARLLKRNGAPARIDDALFAYNHSNRYVKAVKLYAAEMAKSERAFHGYYQWQVYYRMVDGDRVLLEGFPDVPAVKA